LYVNVDNPQRYTMALRERLADMAYYIAYSLRSLRTAYLSIMAYFTDEYSGTIIPSRVLETIHTLDQEALAWILHVPDLRLMDRLSAYMQSTSPSVSRPTPAKFSQLPPRLSCRRHDRPSFGRHHTYKQNTNQTWHFTCSHYKSYEVLNRFLIQSDYLRVFQLEKHRTPSDYWLSRDTEVPHRISSTLRPR
jgi:hypothetical protein